MEPRVRNRQQLVACELTCLCVCVWLHACGGSGMMLSVFYVANLFLQPGARRKMQRWITMPLHTG